MDQHSPITRLPSELVFGVLGFLSRSDYRRLCQISWFYPIAAELLYTEFRGWNGNLITFLTTILLKPWLASRVKHVNLRGLYLRLRKSQRPDASQLQLFIERVNVLPLCPSDRTMWLQYIRKGHGEALAALALIHLPNIRQLYMWTDHQVERRIATSIWTLGLHHLPKSEVSTLGLSSFKFLKEINILSIPISAGELGRICLLPSIRSLTIWDLYETGEEDYTKEEIFQPESNNIDKLGVMSATISSETLIKVVGSCRELKEFVFDSPADGRVPEAYATLIDAIAISQSLLEKLYLRDQKFWSGSVTPIASLSRIRKLRKCIVDASILYTDSTRPLVELFPSGIEKIKLENMHPGFIRDFESVRTILGHVASVRHRTSFFPNLREITLTPDWDLCEDSEDMKTWKITFSAQDSSFVREGLDDDE